MHRMSTMNAPKNKEDKLLHNDCTLIQDSDSCIPKLSPYSNFCLIWFRKFRSILMLSQKNERSRIYFCR